MPKDLTVEELRKQYQKKIDFVDHSLTLFDTDIERLQKELLNFLITGVIAELQTENGIILQSAKNIQILDNFGREMELFKKNFADSVFKRLGENMIKTTGYTSDYFRLMSSKQTISNIEDKIQNIVKIAGVNTDGTLVKDGFLNKLAVSEELKGELSNLVRKSIEQQTDYKTFVNSMKDAVTGKDGVNGAYERYVKGFAHDAFFAQSQQQDNFFADQLGLNYFVYGGTKIKTSRPFCVGGHDKGVDKDFESKLSKVFSRKDAEQFDNMEWSGKIPGIKFIVQKGGYQCRHELMWITKEAAKRKGYPVADGDEGTMMQKISKQQELKEKQKVIKDVKKEIIKPVQKIQPIIEKPKEFIPATTEKEVIERMKSVGVQNISLGKLTIGSANSILRALEQESKLSAISIQTFSGTRAVGTYAFTTNTIAFNPKLMNSRAIVQPIRSYEQKIENLSKALANYEKAYLNQPGYNQRKVIKTINNIKRDIRTAEQNIKDGKPFRYWSTSSSQKTADLSNTATTFHEVGHSHYFKALTKDQRRLFEFDYKNSISDYGMTNREEYFAEWYAHYKMGGTGVPDDLLILFKTL